MLEKIGVFLSSKPHLSVACIKAADALGTWIGSTGRTLVYGGNTSGLMGHLAEAVNRSGGRIFGVVPQRLFDMGCVSPLLHVTFPTVDLADRKATMIQESDVFIALPGGLGTLDEVFTVLAAATLQFEHRPVILYNVEGCWDHLLALLEDLHQRRLIDKRPEAYLKVVGSIEELEAVIADL